MIKLNRRKLCECNCGQVVKPNRRFISGHNGRKHPKPIPNHHLCACGCGELVASDKRFVFQHCRIGSHHKEETLQKMRKPQTEKHKQHVKEALKIVNAKPETHERRSKAAKETQNKPEV